MTNPEKNKAFLAVIHPESKDAILLAIASHYEISKEEAFEEVAGEEAELLVEYLTGSIRTATSFEMKRHGLF